jgi:hypothetical protein
MPVLIVPCLGTDGVYSEARAAGGIVSIGTIGTLYLQIGGMDRNELPIVIIFQAHLRWAEFSVQN